jgi:hypothetical protein
MVRMTRTLQIGLTALALVGVACTPGTQQAASPTPGGAASIVGTWNCGPPGEPGTVVIEIRADGTATISMPEEEPLAVTWSLEGDRGEFTFPVGPSDPFTVEDDRIVITPARGGETVCTPAS